MQRGRAWPQYGRALSMPDRNSDGTMSGATNPGKWGPTPGGVLPAVPIPCLIGTRHRSEQCVRPEAADGPPV